MLFAGRPVDIKQTHLPSAQRLARSFREAAAGRSSLGCSGRAAGGGSGRAVGGALGLFGAEFLGAVRSGNVRAMGAAKFRTFPLFCNKAK